VEVCRLLFAAFGPEWQDLLPGAELEPDYAVTLADDSAQKKSCCG
jgi:hypothetical protein